MKTLTFITLFFFAGLYLSAQIQVKKDSTGNFVYAEKIVYCDSVTGLTLRLKSGEKVPVFTTSAGAYYVISADKKRRLYLNLK